MATASQIAANRRNAQASTGPQSAAGKISSSANSLTRGLYTRSDYVLPEDRALYNEFRETLIAELNPEGILEHAFAAEIVGATWRLRRCSALEADLADHTSADSSFDDDTKSRQSLDRARSHAYNLLQRSVNQLRTLQTDRACRIILNADEDDAGLADFRSVTVAAINYERGKQMYIKTAIARAATPAEEAPAEESPSEEAPGAELGSFCKPAPQPARNALCPCNSGQKYKRCCGRQGPGWPSQAVGAGCSGSRESTAA